MATKSASVSYTPGPWVISANGDHIFGREQGEPDGPTYVCTIPHKPRERQRPERIANARLIAACPELLEALKEAHKNLVGLAAYLATCATDVIIENLETTIADLHRKADLFEAAIQKATGP